MHTFSPKSVRMTGGSLPSSSFSRMNPQRMKKFSFLPRTPKREGIFTAYFAGLIYSRVPTLHKLCVTIRTHELQARATVLMQATRKCVFLVTSVSSIHTGEHPYACKQRGNKNFSVTFLSRHTSERLYKCKYRGTLWIYGCMLRHESSQKMA